MKTTLRILFAVLLTGGGIWLPLIAQAQAVYKPKYLRETNNTFLNLTLRATDDGWIEFRQESIINPATFFETYGSALGLTALYRMNLVQNKTDASQNRHQKYQLFYRNIPVIGADYGLHTRGGVLHVAHGRIPDGLNLSGIAALSEQQALVFALTDLKVTLDLLAGLVPKGKLVLLSPNDEMVAGNIRLAYTFDIGTTQIFIDATTGSILRKIPLLNSCFGHTHDEKNSDGMGHLSRLSDPKVAERNKALVVNGFTHLSSKYPGGQRQQNFETEAFGGAYRLVASTPNSATALETRFDMDNNNPVYGIDPSTGRPVLVALNYDTRDPIVTNPTNDWGTSNQEAATAHWVAYRAYEYYFNLSGVNGLNGAGRLGGISISPTLQNNAYFQTTNNGGNLFFGRSTTTGRSLATVDIVGHEYGHGVSRLLTTGVEGNGLNGSVQSLALNEGFSDIMGTAMERRLIPEWNWTLGEDLQEPVFVRNMIDPSMSGQAQATTYQGANWDFGTNSVNPYRNSGVVSRWFYLLNSPAVNFDDGMRIVINALDYYMNGSSNYYDARNATLFASRALFGDCSPQEKQVVDAWIAVNVGDGIYNYYCEPACNYEAGLTVPSTATPGQIITLQAQCIPNQGASSNACNDIQTIFSGPGGQQQGPVYLNAYSFEAPSTPGTYTYSIALIKSNSNCYRKSATKTVQVMGTPPPPPSGGADCQSFAETCSGNDQEIRSVTLNVATAGNYPLTITYKSGEKPVDALVRVGNATTAIHYNQTTTYTTATTTGSVFLNQGANTIGLNSGSGGGYVCFTNICTGTGGGNPPTPNCDFNIAVNSANASCNQQGVQLTASCNGANCDGLSYSWDGGQSGQTASFNAGGSNGSINYSVTVARSGCSNKTATGTINVSGCGGGNPPVGACQSFGAVCSGNGQEVQYVSLNVATAGSYPLTITYTSHEKAVDAIVRVGSTTTPIHYNQTTYGAYTTATTGSVYLAQGANSIGLSSGSDGGYVCFNNICAGSGSGRVGASDAGMEGNSLVVLPNPSRGVVTVRYRLGVGEAGRLSVVTLQGKELQGRAVTGTDDEQSERFELSHQASGLYLIRLEGSRSGSKTAKLILER